MDSQQWLQRFTLDSNCAEQVYSVGLQPLPSCTSISINALFIKSLNHKSYLNISFTLALGFQANVLAQGRLNSGRGSSKRVEGNANLQKQKIVTNCACFCSATMLTSRLISEIIANHSEVSGCANSCNNFVSKSILINHETIPDTLWKGTFPSSVPPYVGTWWAMPPSWTHSPVSLFLPKIHQNESNTFSKLYLLKWIFLWLPMISIPLNKGDFYETRVANQLALIRFTCN